MYTKISVALLTSLSFIMVIVVTVNAEKPVEGEKKQGVINRIESYIKKDTRLKNGFVINNEKTGETLNLEYDYVHQTVKKVDDGRYFACVDFKDNSGNVYDIDFYLKESDQGLGLDEIVLHKKNGKSIK